MNAHIVLGFFALYVAAVSLGLVLAGRQDAVLALLRRFWGRSLGHSLYFVVNVALPVMICILCLGWGVRNYDATLISRNSELSLQLNLESYRDLKLLQKNNVQDSIGVIYGA